MALKQKIREELHKIIEQVEDEKILQAVHTILEKEVKETVGFDLTEEQKTELDKRIERHKKGESKSYTWEEAKQKIRSGL
ncbi:addiction module protein [Cytophagaceae bacterium ABcell3]|nr:addiction module protein [Cytophagaceae bacterium ABcell3]